MAEYLFRVTFENLDDNDLYDTEFSVSTDDCYFAWHCAIRNANNHIKNMSNDGYSVEITRIELISMFNPKI